MPKFDYQGRGEAGKAARGTVDAADTAAAAARLLEMGITPLVIEPAAAAAKDQTRGPIAQWMDRFQKVDLEELIMFSRQMFTLTKSGVPVNRSVRGIASMAENPLLQEALEGVASDLEAGTTLAVCLSRHPRVFSPMYVNLIYSGEDSGNLDTAFKQLATHLELERETIARIKSATRYPTFVLVAFAVAIGILTVFVIPTFEQVFANFGADLPWQTQLLMSVSKFAVNWWMWILGALVIVWFMLKRYLKTDEGKYRWGRQQLKLPIVGEIFERIALGRFASVFAMMLRAGVPITQAILVVADAVGNRYIGENVRNMAQGIQRGEMLTRTATETGLFTPLVLQMMSVGEETGNVDAMLDEVAGFYEEEVDYKLKRLVDAIEPIMAMGLGILVLILALGIFLPLWDLSTVAR